MLDLKSRIVFLERRVGVVSVFGPGVIQMTIMTLVNYVYLVISGGYGVLLHFEPDLWDFFNIRVFY